ncbi:hypothetical protein [Clostridium perfringens]|uniref:hypothetical protein n=1 Tax=Clostridium perfringens TaxID=1502 RepID=UPI001A2F1D25|nr:hypothetical protein [Clostridium perfringens]HAT4349914.1 hypothetical protein [Clostridium perfringens]
MENINEELGIIEESKTYRYLIRTVNGVFYMRVNKKINYCPVKMNKDFIKVITKESKVAFINPMHIVSVEFDREV